MAHQESFIESTAKEFLILPRQIQYNHGVGHYIQQFPICGVDGRSGLNTFSFFLGARYHQQHALCWIGQCQRLGFLIQQIAQDGNQGLKKSDPSLKVLGQLDLQSPRSKGPEPRGADTCPSISKGNLVHYFSCTVLNHAFVGLFV